MSTLNSGTLFRLNLLSSVRENVTLDTKAKAAKCHSLLNGSVTVIRSYARACACACACARRLESRKRLTTPRRTWQNRCRTDRSRQRPSFARSPHHTATSHNHGPTIQTLTAPSTTSESRHNFSQSRLHGHGVDACFLLGACGVIIGGSPVPGAVTDRASPSSSLLVCLLSIENDSVLSENAS